MEANRLLNFDEEVVVPVRLGGREFTLTQQSRPVLERVLAAASEEITADADAKVTDILFGNWDRALPIFALILGEETPETVAFLHANLKLPAALKIYETWWEINEIESFFVRGGRLNMSPRLAAALAEVELPAELPTEATD